MFLQIGFSMNKIRDKLLFKKLCKSYKKFLKITSNSEENRIVRKKDLKYFKLFIHEEIFGASKNKSSSENHNMKV